MNDVAVTPFGGTATEETLGRRPMVSEGDGSENMLLLDLDWPTVDATAGAAVDTSIDTVAMDEVLARRESII